VSSGQKIGHIMGCPARLICRQPPASVASLVAHQTAMRVPGRSCGCWWGSAFEYEFAGCRVLACVAAGEGVQLQGLSSGGVCFAEGQPVGQVLEIGSVDVHFELVASLRVEGRFGVGAGDGRVDVHHEHGAVAAGKDVQVVDEERATCSVRREPGGRKPSLSQAHRCPRDDRSPRNRRARGEGHA